jgi:acyl-CoA synthetase (AMP-forming)/AMP-acid ligase II
MTGIGSAAKAAPETSALVWGGRPLSYEGLNERQRRIAGAMRSEGVKEGDRIAVVSGNRPEFLEVTIAALRAGVIPIPVNALLTPTEIGYILEDSSARWVFADRPIEMRPGVEQIVTFGDAYERMLAEAKPAQLADHARGRPMHYTSGTTGSPKGVWVGVYDEQRAARVSEDFRSMWNITGDDIHLVCSPLAHSAPHRFALRTLEAGGTVVLQPRFEPDETLAALELFGVTTTFVVPTHLERILATGDAIRRHDLSSIRLLAHAGAPIRAETKQRVLELFPSGSVWEFYGSTENHATRISPDEWTRKPGSVGTPRTGGRILILDESGAALPPGETGEVWIQDPHAERFEYWRAPKKTARAWRGDAFTVGDLGLLDEDGYLFLTGRRDDVIITGGVNVYPAEVEAVIAQHPSVAEVVVYGTDDEEWGQSVHALVVPAFGQPLDLQGLKAWVRERLAGFKCPLTFEAVEELPRNATGKVVRRPPDEQSP